MLNKRQNNNEIWGKKGQNMYKGVRKESAFNIK